MKAYDTEISFAEIEAIDLRNASGNFTDALVDVARRQAEVSFSAGVRTVVQWVESHMLVSPSIDSLTKFYPYYIIEQGHLKSQKDFWGIE